MKEGNKIRINPPFAIGCIFILYVLTWFTFQLLRESEDVRFVAEIVIDEFKVTVELGRADVMSTGSFINIFWYSRDVTVNVM